MKNETTGKSRGLEPGTAALVATVAYPAVK